MELDHVLYFAAAGSRLDAFLSGFALSAPGLSLLPGLSERRVAFEGAHLAVGTVVDPQSALLLRGAEDAPCPLGVVLRGRLPEEERGRFLALWSAEGTTLWVHRESWRRPELLFVAVLEGENGAPPPRPTAPGHVCGARRIQRARFVGLMPELGTLCAPGVSFEVNSSRLEYSERVRQTRAWLTIEGLDAPRDLFLRLVLQPAVPAAAGRARVLGLQAEGFSERLWLYEDGRFRYVCDTHVIHGGQYDEDDQAEVRVGAWRFHEPTASSPGVLVLDVEAAERLAGYGTRRYPLKEHTLAFLVDRGSNQFRHAAWNEQAGATSERLRATPCSPGSPACPGENRSDHFLQETAPPGGGQGPGPIR